jgi:hypothetical protein
MRGLGDFQRAQMKRVDPRVSEMFDHVRRARQVAILCARHLDGSRGPAKTIFSQDTNF